MDSNYLPTSGTYKSYLLFPESEVLPKCYHIPGTDLRPGVHLYVHVVVMWEGNSFYWLIVEQVSVVCVCVCVCLFVCV